MDQSRLSLMQKIRNSVFLEQASIIAELDQERRERQRNGDPVDPDDSLHHISESSAWDDDLSFGLPFTVMSIQSSTTSSSVQKKKCRT